MFQANIYNAKEEFSNTLVFFKTSDLQVTGLYLMVVYAILQPLGLVSFLPLTLFGVIPSIAYLAYKTFVPDAIKKIFVGNKLRHLFNKKMLVPDSLGLKDRIYTAVFHDVNSLSNSMSDLSYKPIVKKNIVKQNETNNQEPSI